MPSPVCSCNVNEQRDRLASELGLFLTRAKIGVPTEQRSRFRRRPSAKTLREIRDLANAINALDEVASRALP